MGQVGDVKWLPYLMGTTQSRGVGYEDEVQFTHTAYWFQPRVS